MISVEVSGRNFFKSYVPMFFMILLRELGRKSHACKMENNDFVSQEKPENQFVFQTDRIQMQTWKNRFSI